MLVVSFVIDWRAGLLILGSVSVASFLLIRLRSVAVPAHDAEREIQSQLYGDLEERLGGLEDLRSLDAGEYVVHRLEHHSSRWWHAARRAAFVGDGAYTAAATAFSVGSVLTLGRRACCSSATSVITLGALLALFRFSQMVRQPIERIAEQMREFQKASAGARRAARLLATVPTLPEGRGDHLPPGPLPVDLDDVAFAYAGDSDVLVDLDLHLAPGTRLGVVGRTGSGKSTLGRLLARLWDVTNGSVRLGGVDVRDADTDGPPPPRGGGEPGRRAAPRVAPRQPHVPRHRRGAPTTTCGRPSPTSGSPSGRPASTDGLDTMLDGGAGLSAGQAQLLAFARVLLADPGLVLLDEATSRLDPETETGSPKPPTGRSAAAPW